MDEGLFSSNPEATVFLQCNQCYSCIAMGDTLCFFEIGRSTHLTIKHEVLAVFMETSTCPLTFQPQTNEKKMKISSHEMFCKVCNSGLGSMNAVGPVKENIPCFRSKACTLVKGKDDIAGDWPTVAKFISKHIQIRSLASFYGGDFSDCSMVDRPATIPTILPSLKHVTTCKLRELTNSKPRQYQIECFAAAALGNCVIYLPTGAGKTLIAAMMVSFMHRLNPAKTIFFIVDRVPLAYQQGQYLTEQTSLNVLIACGETAEEIPVKKLKEYPVIACTAQVLINYFIRKLVSMEDVSLVIFDEIHNAVKAHPYVNILERYFQPLEVSKRPILLGLTASPVSGDAINMNVGLGELCQLTDARVYLPCMYWDNLMTSINRPKIQFHVVVPSDESIKFTAALSSYLRHIINNIVKTLKLKTGFIDLPSVEAVSQVRGFLRLLSEKAHATKNVEVVDSIIHLQQILSAQELSSILGPHYARKYLEDTFSKHRRSKEELDDAATTLLATVKDMDSLSGKLNELLVLLDGIETTDSTRAIVFVQTKKTARHLCHIIESRESLETKWKPAFFVGQSAGQLDGMSWTDHQAPILQKFRSGEHRLLISTSVLQEGLDVPICDHIILFDQSWTLTSFIQSRGRARAKESRYLLICDQTQKASYEALMQSEEVMHRSILRHIRDSKSLNPTIAICAALLVNQVNTATDWLLNGSESNSEQMGSSKDLRRNFRAIKIFLHNISEDKQSIDSFPFFEEVSLKNLQSQVEPGLVFPDRKILTVSGEALAGNSLRLGDVAKLIVDLSSKLISHSDILLSYRIGSQNLNQGTEQFMFVADSIQFGALISPKYFNCQASVSLACKVVINLSAGAIQIFFFGEDTKSLYRIDFEFLNIDRFILLELQSPANVDTSLYIPLRGAASYYYSKSEALTDIKLATINLLSWERATVEDLHSVFSNLEFSVFKVEFHVSRNVQDHLLSILRKMESFGVSVMFAEVQVVERLADMVGPEDMGIIASVDPTDFEFIYDLLVLKSSCSISLLYRTRLSVLVTYLAGLRKDLRHRVLTEFALALVDSRYADPAELVFSIINNTIVDPTSYVLPLPFDHSDSSYDSKSNTTLIRYVVLTPTRLIFTAAKKMIRNRILRAFNPEYFIRVVFRDEDMQKLSTVKTGAGLASVYSRIKAFLTEGIVIGDRKYEFLAMSSSQLRDHGCWFVCTHKMTMPINGQLQEVLVNSDFIRSWCGDFSSIKNVAKYVARLGQSLSASFDVSKVEQHEYEMISDYEVITEAFGKNKKYVFSDGIGKLSYSKAIEISKSMDFDHVPSAFQIRYAGFKGVLAVDPLSPSENDPEDKLLFQFRPSMKKFSSGHYVLEVLNWSEYIPCYLNRQVLLIMSSLGVTDESFMRLQDQMLKEMPETLFDSKSAKAALSHGIHVLPKLKLSSHTSFNFEAEPFFRSLLLSIYRRHLVELLTRSRVFIPMGRILMGVIDETGTLEEDEIFVQITRQVTDEEAIECGLLEESNQGRMVVNSMVSVAKNPCMHPGDLRRLKTVRNAFLEKYHYDCVVFPRKGKRPITDTCSGSDLDGDLYFVTWDPSLLPPTEYEPMDYSGPGAKEVDEVKTEDIVKFLVEFISNDQLGTIANAHVAHADTAVEGVKSATCMHLAYLFSLAVDFPKTGLVPTFPKEYRVTSWPDFMQKHGMTTHVSTKVMGKMFRKAKSIFYPNVSYSPRIFSPDQSFLCEGHEKYLEKAKVRYVEYSNLMSFTLRLYGLGSEAAIFSGSISDVKGSIGKEDNSDIYDVVRRKTGELIKTFKHLFKEDLESDNEAELLASAWYRVTYESPIKPRGLNSAILSFPWIMADILLGIQSKNSNTLKESTKSELGSQAIAFAKKILSEDIGPCTVDRLNFFNHLRNLLLSGLKCNVRIELSGTTALFLHCKNSDLNVWIDLSVEKIPEIVDILESTFSVQIKGNYIEYRGSPFHFTIFFNKESHLHVLRMKSALRQNLSLMVASLMLIQWGRSQTLIRSTAKHAGKLSATSLIALIMSVLPECDMGLSEDSSTNGRSFLIEDEVRKFTELEDVLEAFKTSNRQEETGKIFLQCLKYLAFEDETFIKNHIKHCDFIKISDSGIRYLREYAFQAYQLLAQTLSIAQLWETSHSPEVEKEVTIANRKPRLAKKHGMSNSVFMEGASTLLFEESSSQNDLVSFSLYQLRRRPQHADAQCYALLLTDPSPYDSSDTTKFLYQQYFAHSFRQFDLARRTGNEEFGIIKATVKFGALYVTNLPKLFQEESSSATVGRVQEALKLGYKYVSDVATENFYKAKSKGFGLDFQSEDKLASPLLSPSVTPKFDLEEIINSLQEKEELEDSFVKAPIKRKSTLSSMSSSFEPYVHSEGSIKAFLEDNGFIMKEEISGYAVSVTLYNSSVKGNCDFQVMYTPSMEFVKLRYRPLRWSLVDVRSGSESQQDYRFLLSSAKDVDLDECSLANQEQSPSSNEMSDGRPDIRQLIKEGVVKIESDPSANSITLRVVTDFRKNEHLLVRSSHTSKYHLPTHMARLDFLQKYPSLRAVPPFILEKMRVMLIEVTEYSEHDPSNGLFQYFSDKFEVELSFGLDWEELREGRLSHELITAMWQIGLIFRKVLSSNE